jgi:Family of unknown function (DUF5947)
MIAESRLAQIARRQEPPALERCELCGAVIAADHRHLLDPETRGLLCACRPCALLFERGGRYRLIPTGRRRLDDVPDLEWEELRLPVDVAFFLHDSAAGRDMAFYPGPMGATESQLPLQLGVLRTIQPDVEAVLVDRHLGARRHWIVPIDDCFRLVGLVRTHWRGLTGGKDVWAEIARFFDDLERR